MDPLISVAILNETRTFSPGDTLRFACQVDAVSAAELSAIEASVMWRTEGKGEEDIGVHFFERITPADIEAQELTAQREYDTVLPRSPLSYEGTIVKIRWAVRVRVLLRNDGKETYLDAPFQLGNLVSNDPPEEADKEEEEEEDNEQTAEAV